MIDAKLEHTDFQRNLSVIPDKLRSSTDPGSIVKLRRPSMDPGASPGWRCGSEETQHARGWGGHHCARAVHLHASGIAFARGPLALAARGLL